MVQDNSFTYLNYPILQKILNNRNFSLYMFVKRILYLLFSMIDGAVTWAVKKAQEKMLGVTEARMVRRMRAVKKLDRNIQENEKIYRIYINAVQTCNEKR